MHLISLGEQTILQVVGKDRQSWLQNLCTQDLRLLVKQEGSKPSSEPWLLDGLELFLTDVKGRAAAHGWIIADADRLLLMIGSASPERLIKQLDRYIIREDVVVSDVSSSFQLFALVDPKGEEIAAKVPATEAQHLGVLLTRCPVYGAHALAAMVPTAEVEAWRAIFVKEKINVEPWEEWEWMRIASDWPKFGIDFSEENLAQEANRDAQAISFTKGCYLGQETVARLECLGQLQKKRCRITIEGSVVLPSGAELSSQSQGAGWITSSAKLPDQNVTLAMAIVKRQYYQPGSQLEVDGYKATVQ